MYVAFQGSGNMWVTWARIAFSTDGDKWEFLLDINDEPQVHRREEGIKKRVEMGHAIIGHSLTTGERK